MHKKIDQYLNKKMLVLGLGISGCSAASFLLSRGANVFAFDEKTDSIKENDEVKSLMTRGLQLYQKSSPDNIGQFDALVVSPGIPCDHLLYRQAADAGLEIIGEAELAFRYFENPCIGITGTNGKTTVTLLIEHVLNHQRIPAKAVGNVGVPLTSLIDNVDPSIVLVVELSSYQLETLHSKVLDAAVLLNITPDHLDRYANMMDYAEAKVRVFDCIKSEGICFISEECYLEWKNLLTTKSVFIYDQDKSILNYKYSKSGHDYENLLAAFRVCQLWGITAQQFMKAQESFVKPPHRLEFVRNIAGVNFIDDSKGTNIDAVIKAVRSLNEPIILIAGGVDKGFSYSSWIKHFEGKVSLICAIGEAASKIQTELSSNFRIELFNDLQQAVSFAAKSALAGSTVLLSPGCSSYDMFKDYAHRGREFCRIVNELDNLGNRLP